MQAKDSSASIFSDYDEDCGYNKLEEEMKKENEKEPGKVIYAFYRIMHENGMNFNECQQVDFFSYIDFLMYCLDNPIEERRG